MADISDTLAALKRDAESKTGKNLFAWDELKSELLIAFLDGQLVPVPSVEKLARAMAEQANDYDGDVLQWECWADSATAAIAAMQETKP